MNITRASLRNLPAAGNERRVYWDDAESGFGAVQHPSGGISYFLQIRIGGRSGKQIKRKLGNFPSMTPEQARIVARQIKANAVMGIDVIADNKRRIAEEKAAKAAVVTMAQLVAEYRRRKMATKKASSTAEDERRLAKFVIPKFGERDARSITRAEIDELHKSFKATPYEANRVLALLSAIFALAVLDGRRADNPVRGITKFPERKIERYLTDEEATKLDAALKAAEKERPEPVAAIRLMIATGARRNEVLEMRWQDVDIDSDRPLWRLPDSKTGGRSVPLNSAAVALLCDRRDTIRRSGDVFSLPLDGRVAVVNRLWRDVMKACSSADGTRLRNPHHSLTNDESAKLNAALDATENEPPEAVATIRLLIATGASRAEVLGMRWQDLDIDSEQPLWRLPDGKTRLRSISLDRDAVAVLCDLRESLGRSGDIFSFSLDGRVTAVKRLWRDLMKTCSFAERTRLHDLRHSFASLLASRGVPLAVAGRAMGHKSITTTQRYAHLFDEALRAGVEKAVR